jgi:hypothetical protein
MKNGILVVGIVRVGNAVSVDGVIAGRSRDLIGVETSSVMFWKR